jgi:hypothetical protein
MIRSDDATLMVEILRKHVHPAAAAYNAMGHGHALRLRQIAPVYRKS